MPEKLVQDPETHSDPLSGLGERGRGSDVMWIVTTAKVMMADHDGDLECW